MLADQKIMKFLFLWKETLWKKQLPSDVNKPEKVMKFRFLEKRHCGKAITQL